VLLENSTLANFPVCFYFRYWIRLQQTKIYHAANLLSRLLAARTFLNYRLWRFTFSELHYITLASALQPSQCHQCSWPYRHPRQPRGVLIGYKNPFLQYTGYRNVKTYQTQAHLQSYLLNGTILWNLKQEVNQANEWSLSCKRTGVQTIGQ